MRPEPDPYAAMWDTNWVSTINDERKDVVQQHTAPKR
jgi:hypothetical protein